MSPATPPAEVTVDEGLIRALLLGDRLAVRMPRIHGAAPLITAEQTWLPWLASRLPVAVPVPVRQGRPGAGFPWPWSVVPWVAGRAADSEPLDVSQSGVFGGFLASLHQPAPGSGTRMAGSAGTP